MCPCLHATGSRLTLSKVLLVQAPAGWGLAGKDDGTDGLAAAAEQHLVELRTAAQAAYLDMNTTLVGPMVSHMQELLALC